MVVVGLMRLSTVFQVVGAGFVVAALWVVSPVLGLGAVGLILLLFGVASERVERSDRGSGGSRRTTT